MWGCWDRQSGSMWDLPDLWMIVNSNCCKFISHCVRQLQGFFGFGDGKGCGGQ